MMKPFFINITAISLLSLWLTACNQQPINSTEDKTKPSTTASISPATNTTNALTINCTPEQTQMGNAPPTGLEIYCVNSEGQKEGLYLAWYNNTQLMQRLHYKNGKEHGKQQAWWPNGKLMMEGISMEGVRYKGFKYWDVMGRASTIEFQAQ